MRNSGDETKGGPVGCPGTEAFFFLSSSAQTELYLITSDVTYVHVSFPSKFNC